MPSLLTAYLILSIFLGFYYIYIILRYMEGWNALPKWNVPLDFQASTKVTVLIPARNEAENIHACLSSILNQHFPKSLLQIIVIDDHSTDETVEVVKNINHPCITVLKLANFITNQETQSFKKRAIEIGITHAEGELIITTDADCLTPPNWLQLVVSYYETHQPVFIAAPVNFYDEKSTLERFQSLDFMGMMCVTGAGIHRQFMNMCNGANLAYPKQVFETVGGFEGIDHLASGDDMLLMQKIAQHFPNKIAYLKNPQATILTKAKSTLRSFLQQRIRWTTKSTSYQEWRVTFILAMVFFFSSNLLLSFFLIPFIGWIALGIFLVSFFIKMIMDYFFLKNMARFFNRLDLMSAFFPALMLHILYIVVVGILGNVIKKYEWKGRRVR